MIAIVSVLVTVVTGLLLCQKHSYSNIDDVMKKHFYTNYKQQTKTEHYLCKIVDGN